MSILENGKSESATVTLRLLDFDKEITNWSGYTTSSNFTQPCDKFSFKISAEDTELYKEMLIPGSSVQICVNDHPQCTGFIEERDIKYSRSSGTNISIVGRDILCRMVNGNVPPGPILKTGMTVGDLISNVMAPFGFKTLYNTQDTNLNVMTGYPNNKSLTTKTFQAQISGYKTDANGNGIKGSDGKFTSENKQVTITEVVSNLKPGLTKLNLTQCRATESEGAYEYVRKLISREGLILKAASDGSGLMVISPDYDSNIGHKLICRKDDPSQNNVIEGSGNINFMEQPSVAIAFGFGTGLDKEKAALVAIMVNEITGLDDNGEILPEIHNLLTAYKHGILLPLRPELIPKKRSMTIKNAFCPVYFKDADSKNIAQLSRFLTRKMASHQMKSSTLKYTVDGHICASNDLPWMVNTMVNVDDDILDVHEEMWVLERTFRKTRGVGTFTDLTLIKPHTLLLE